MSKVLVLGSTGNIGCYVVEHLLNRGVTVKAGVTNVEKGKAIFTGKNVEVVQFNFLQPGTFDGALEDVKKLFLVRPPQLAFPKQDMLPFLQKAKSAGVEHIVFVSLLGVEKNPVVPHRKIENYIRELGFTYTFLRPSFFMQNLHTTHRDDIVLRNELYMPVGKAKTSFIDTRDIGEIAAICLTENGHVNQGYTLTGCEAITYDEVATIMSEVLNRPIIYKNPGILEFRKTLINIGTPKAFANVMTMLYTMTKLGTAKDVTDTTETLLKRKPTTFRQYVTDHRDYFIGG